MPEWIFSFGIVVIQTLQSVQSPGLDGVCLFLAFLGHESGYLIMIPLIWWLKDWRLGAYLFVILIVSTYFNILIKDAVHLPRPFMASRDILQLANPSGWSFPSGHSQMAMTFWGSLALHVRRNWFSGIAITIIVLTGISRIYLGVHYPSDVLAGFLIGGMLIWFFHTYRDLLKRKASELSASNQVVLALIIPLALILIHPSEDAVTAMSALSGGIIGLVVYHERLKSHAQLNLPLRNASVLIVLKAIPGLGILGALYLGPKFLMDILPEEPHGQILALSLRFVRYFIIGVWFSLGAPLLFQRFETRMA